ncbi:hypothetical protein AtDm6_1619 [Acetobacter tropicalis]|uniref:Uncharacterized protein n=1 Tax=Acetobacter tropicalis TaxID=104102 RepID=A0A094YPX2_9PROT|nr:hypothetical protein AtDm6_1619 [Acetobacter tropicalis]
MGLACYRPLPTGTTYEKFMAFEADFPRTVFLHIPSKNHKFILLFIDENDLFLPSR